MSIDHKAISQIYTNNKKTLETFKRSNFQQFPPPQINQPLQASNSSKISAAFWASPLLPQASTKAQQAFTPGATKMCDLPQICNKKTPISKKKAIDSKLIQIPKTQIPYFLYFFLSTHYSQGRVRHFHVLSRFVTTPLPVKTRCFQRRRSGLDQDHKRSSAGTNRWHPPVWWHLQLEKRTDRLRWNK